MTLEFSLQIKKTKIPNLMKIHPVEAETQMNRWKDMMKLIVAFRNFANVSK